MLKQQYDNVWSVYGIGSPYCHFILVDQPKFISKINQLRLSELLESKAPGYIVEIRPSYRVNLISVDIQNNNGV